ncbi:MAG: glycoside hydrolase family 25 protein [Actinomycetota bacterium]|nr:glycoside hydrolase family 25 protein [Actinomycetota bacterium]
MSLHRRELGAVLIAVAAAFLLAPAAGGARYVRGIDVSHYNGSIDWQPAAASGIEFAFMQATKGNDGVDLRYPTFRDDAAAAAVWIGAYHFARPGGKTASAVRRDALSEARHFVAYAQPAADDLVPALDLERTGRLSPALLVLWTRTWLREAERLGGARPMIYSSVAFWRDSLGNTTEFASGGYHLWLARWTTRRSPEIPAGAWAGFRWTFWQWASCGRVPGLRGCVDLDRFRASDLTPYLVGSAPQNVVEPEVTGAAAVGQTVTASEGGWEGAEPLRLSYTWQRCNPEGAACTTIAGETGATYVLTGLDAGRTVIATVTATNRAGSATSASPPTPVVA